jgi:hypothetical protein
MLTLGISVKAPIAESSLCSRLSSGARHKNLLLDQRGQDDFSRLELYLKSTPFKQHTVLFEAERKIEHVYFPTGGVVSLVVTLATGEMIEAAMVGSDGGVGASAALDGRISLSRGIVQLGGDIVVCSIDGLKSASLQSPKHCPCSFVMSRPYMLRRNSRRQFGDTPCTGASIAGEGPGGLRYSELHARISRGNVGGSANNRDCRGAHLAVCRSNQVQTRENPDRRCRSAARWRV